MMLKNILLLAACLSIAVGVTTTLELGVALGANTTNGTARFDLETDSSNHTLFIKVDASDGYPLLVASSNHKHFKCTSRNKFGFCVISNVAPKANFTVEVFCVQDCSFSINAYQSQFLHMDLHNQISIEFNSDQEILLAELSLIQISAYSEIKVVALVDNPESVTGQLELFSSIAPAVPAREKHDFKGQLVWNDEKTLVLSKYNLTSQGNLRIFLSGVKNMKVVLSCYVVSGYTRNITLGQTTYDDVAAGNSKTYILHLGNSTDQSITVRLTKYSGNSTIRITADGKNNEREVKGLVSGSIQQFVIDSEAKKLLGIETVCYIEIIGKEHSTFMLRSDHTHSNFTMLDDDMTVLGTLQSRQVDNYIYPLLVIEQEKEQDNFKQFTFRAQSAQQSIYCGVRNCPQFEAGQGTCLPSSFIQATRQFTQYKQIPGVNITDKAWMHSTFKYDIRNCTRKSQMLRLCVFHVACFNRPPISATDITTYEIRFQQTASETILSEGVAKRDKLEENQTRKYYFELKELANIKQVRFYISVISGDCLMSAALDRRNHTFTDDGVKFAYYHTLQFSQNLIKQYFLQVRAYSHSSYSLFVQIIRGDAAAGTSVQMEPLHLKAGIPQNVILEDENTESRFWIRLSKPKQLYVHINNRQDLDVIVFPAHKKQITGQLMWNSTNNFVRVSYPNETATSYLEFIVVVKNNSSKMFSIVYDEWGKCTPVNVNQHLEVSVLKDSYPRCFSYVISKLAPLMIAVDESYFDRGTGQNFVSLIWDDLNEIYLHNKLTTLDASQLAKRCPGLNNKTKGHTESCFLKVKIETERATSMTITVQYLNQEIELFDGLSIIMNSAMSRVSGAYFYYDIPNRQAAIMVTIKSSTDTRYRLVAKIVDRRQYYQRPIETMYPQYDDQTGLVSSTNHTGSTVLVIDLLQLSNQKENEDLLLISLFSSTINEQSAQYNIEVVQHIVELSPFELKSGYVQKAISNKYLVSANNSMEELVVHVNTLLPYCTKLELYNSKNNQSLKLRQSFSNQLLITPENSWSNYTVEVIGLDSCTYEIFYTPVSKKVYELIAGHPFSLDFQQGTPVYFLYYNLRNESFKVTEILDHGAVNLQATSLQGFNLSDINTVIEYTIAHPKWEFGETHHDSALQIKKGRDTFCVRCYFLIMATAEQPASGTLLLHNDDSPVQLRENKYVKDLLEAEQSTQYIYLRISPFKLAFTVFFGNPQAVVTLTNNQDYSLTLNITQSKDYLVPYDGPQVEGNNAFQNEAFQISVSCSQRCSYSLLVDSNGFPRTIVSGLPHKFSIASKVNPSCVQFVSLTKNSSAHLFLSSQNISSLSYNVRCFKRFVWQPCENATDLILNTQNDQGGVNLELRSMDGIYLACASLNNTDQPVSLTALLSYNMKFQHSLPEIYSTMTITSNEPEVVIKMDDHQNKSTMVEIIECSGDVELSVSNGSKSQGQEITLKNSKTAGHFVALLPSSEDSDVKLAKVKLHSLNEATKATFLFRYSHFPAGSQPFDSISVEDEQIEHSISDSQVIVRLSAVTSNDEWKLVGAEYKVFLARKLEDVRAAQCGASSPLVKSKKLTGKQIEQDTVEIIFQREEITDYLGEQQELFIGAFCQAQVKPTKPTDEATGAELIQQTSFYRVIYNSAQIAHRISESSRTVTYVLLLLIALAVIVILLLIGKYIIPIIRKRTLNAVFMEDAEKQPDDIKPDAKDPGATVKNLVVSETGYAAARFDTEA